MCVSMCVCVCVYARTPLIVPTVAQAVGLIPVGGEEFLKSKPLIMMSSWFEFLHSIGALACLHEGWTAGACVLTGGSGGVQRHNICIAITV